LGFSVEWYSLDSSTNLWRPSCNMIKFTSDVF